MKNIYPSNEGQEDPVEPPPAAGRPQESRQRSPDEALQLGAQDMAESEAEILRAEVVSLNEKILRLAAELENTRRRGDREKQDAGRYAIAGFARDLLSVIDAFERAIATAPADKASASIDSLYAILEGVKLSEASMLAVLERHGVKRLNPQGEKFDPNLHQAVAQAPGAAPSGFVLDVAQPGFVIGDRVLRAAMVVVSTGPGVGGPVDVTA
jgi:molecular chaperone GrpE